MLWRFDPMIITEKITFEKTLDRFKGLCDSLFGSVRRCFTSIMVPYRKIEKRVRSYEESRGDKVRAPELDELAELSLGLAGIAGEAGITVHACCAGDLIGFGVYPARCVDGDFILSLWPDCGLDPEPAPTRKGCGCHRSIDLGAYDTCPHRCLYCYANFHDSLIRKRHASHRPESLSMIE
jgi:hypothetical protein